MLRRRGIGPLAGDGFQMPGVFLAFHGEVIASYRPASAADRPSYVAIADGASGPFQPVHRASH